MRRALLGPFSCLQPDTVDFLEVAPENWIGIGGRLGREFQQLAERYPLVLHGLSLNIGGSDPIDRDLVRAVGAFMDEYQCTTYSEHLTYCAEGGHLYDLLPIPFTEAAVRHTAERVDEVQQLLGRRIALENASYYAAPQQAMPESEFINAVLDQADCELLLDVNNIYVNSINHRYDAMEFLSSLPLRRARYIHVAGHYNKAEDLKVDTHGADVIDPVWELLAEAYRLCGPLPTLLERDFNFPPLEKLLLEVQRIREIQARAGAGGLQDCA